MKTDLLIEIGCEEIPARFVSLAESTLKEELERRLTGAGVLVKGKGKSWSTPRRLAVYFSEVRDREPDREEVLTGPPATVAFDSHGKHTKAAEGFAGKAGVPIAKLQVTRSEKGEYLTAIRKIQGRATAAVLQEAVPEALSSLPFPKRMRWQPDTKLSFVRPIRWMVALMGSKVVPVVLPGIRAGNQSFSHRVLGNKAITIRKAGEYEKALRKGGVLASFSERKKGIENQMRILARKARLQIVDDPELVDILANSVESPLAQLGTFEESFLGLPREVLVTVMKHHQKYLSLCRSNGELAAHFIAVSDRPGRPRPGILRGHETVLRARFRDAQFFWKADLAVPFADRLEQLKRVTFHSKLGSYFDKTRRMEMLAGWLGERVDTDGRRADSSRLHADKTPRSTAGRHADAQYARRAAQLSKCDLTTLMVAELPELQGVIGSFYAAEQGQPPEVCDAIREHYQPAGADDPVPEMPEGICLALADKLDSLTGCFSVGDQPTGSRDPYGLRRAGNGIVRILLDHSLDIPLRSIAGKSLDSFEHAQAAEGTLLGSVLAFLEERARHHFRDVCGFRYDEVNAVFRAGWDPLPDARARLAALHDIRRSPDFEPLAASFKRIRNILEQAGGAGSWAGKPVKAESLHEEAEEVLYRTFSDISPVVERHCSAGAYESALRTISTLRPSVDRFFDEVLVNAQEAAVRENRLSLLALLLEKFSTIADFSEIAAQS